MEQVPVCGCLDPYLDADFERCVEGAIDAGFENEQIADMDGLDEVDVIHGGGDDMGAGVAIGGHGAGQVDEVHETAAEEIAERVGVVGRMISVISDCVLATVRTGGLASVVLICLLAPSFGAAASSEFTSGYNEMNQ